MTVRELINGSLRLIGAIAQGEAPSANETQEALMSLNDMIESWSVEGYVVYNQVRENFSLTPSKETYKIGTDVTNDFVTEIPLIIKQASVENNGFEMAVRVVDDVEWAQIPNKSIQSSYPSILYFNRGAPNAEIHLWPVPNIAKDLYLYSQKRIAAFGSINDTVVLPPGYAKAIRYNLAIELAPEYGKEASATVVNGAIESKAAIARMNDSIIMMTSDALSITSNSRPFNIYKGT